MESIELKHPLQKDRVDNTSAPFCAFQDSWTCQNLTVGFKYNHLCAYNAIAKKMAKSWNVGKQQLEKHQRLEHGQRNPGNLLS